MHTTIELSRRGFMGLTAAVVATAGLAAGTRRACAEEGAASDGSYDLVVVGAGAAGLTAATKAAQDGARVVVLEAEGTVGGTTRHSVMHYKFVNDWWMERLPQRTEDSDAEIVALLDRCQEDMGDFNEARDVLAAQIEEYLTGDSTVWFDSVERMLVEHYIYCQGEDADGNPATFDYAVIEPAYRNQGEVADWLMSNGVEFETPDPTEPIGDGGPLSAKPEGEGFGMMGALEEAALSAGVQILTGVKAVDLMVEDGRVAGVVAEDGTQYAAAKGVLLACGGFASNGDMLAAYDNRYAGVTNKVGSCEPASCDGTGIAMAQGVGGAITNMQNIMFFPYPMNSMIGFDVWFDLIRSAGKLCVNEAAVRFANDGNAAMLGQGAAKEQPDTFYYVVGDASNIAYHQEKDYFDMHVALGNIVTGQSLEEVAEAAGLDAAALVATVESYNAAVEAGGEDEFGRDMDQAEKVEDGPYMILMMREWAQNTMGGLVIDATGHVCDEAGAPIEGLYAAGEITGNFDGANRRHGDNAAQILYYGYLVGSSILA